VCPQAAQEQVDPGDELVAVAVVAELGGDAGDEGEPGRVEGGPACGLLPEEFVAADAGLDRLGVGAVLRGDADEVEEERGRGRASR
jgi:hypothetical protein